MFFKHPCNLDCTRQALIPGSTHSPSHPPFIEIPHFLDLFQVMDNYSKILHSPLGSSASTKLVELLVLVRASIKTSTVIQLNWVIFWAGSIKPSIRC